MFIRKHNMMPTAVGRIKARAVHLRLPVSFFIVRHVVPQGKWKRQSIATLRAVSGVQPHEVSTLASSDKLL